MTAETPGVTDYRIHFGKAARSKYYSQAVELAGIAEQHEVRGPGEDEWHIVTVSEGQLDLLAALYSLAVKVPSPRVYGADLQYLYAYCQSGGTYEYAHASRALKERAQNAAERLMKETGGGMHELTTYLKERFLAPISRDMEMARQRLIAEGMIEYVDPQSGLVIRAKKSCREPIKCIREIKARIQARDYAGAVNAYYRMLGDEYYGPLTYELLYLKRLGGMPLDPRDLLYFKPEASRSKLVVGNLDEYVALIAEVMKQARDEGMPMPIDILCESVPTMEDLVDRRIRKWHQGVHIWKGRIERDFTPVEVHDFSYKWDWCQEGRFFKRFPDPILFSRALEPRQRKESLGLWVTYDPEFLDAHVYQKGLHVNGVDVYYHRAWGKYVPGCKRAPDFTTATSMEEVSRFDYMPTETVESIDPGRIQFTGRKHAIEGQHFYEIDIMKTGGNIEADVIGNPLRELIDEILRESENLLRERHGLPRIGEGWVSEMELHNLILSRFPSVIHHARPDWLRPQHLDIFIPDFPLAIEYHGQQHFEPLAFFGGEEALKETKRRDARKARKCKDHGVRLIIWRFDEPIELSLLESKLRGSGP